MLGFGVFLAAAPGALASTNGLALTPPMGMNTWYKYGTGINEALIKSFADEMATNGMKAAGYIYLNVDDGWAGYRDTNGVMVPDTNKFPNGMKALADYVHAKGLKFGLYAVGGFYTCAHLPGSMGYEILDAQTFAAWGVDYLKYEGCSIPWHELVPHEELFSARMGQALIQTGRPILFSLSIGPFENWIPGACNLPRGTGDPDGTWTNVLYHIDVVAQSPFPGRPGMFNDPDVIPSGISPTLKEEYSAFSMWCILAAPLLTATLDPYRLTVLCNPETIAVDQDPAGIQGTCVASNGNTQVWRKPLGSSNSTTVAAALFNRGEVAADITANWSNLSLPPGVATVRDLWAKAYIANGTNGNFANSYTVNVPAHGVKFLKITAGATLPLPPVGTNYLSDLNWLASTTNESDSIQLDRFVGFPTSLIKLHGVTYPKGLGVQAYSRADYYLGGAVSRFRADIGIDDRACCGFGSVIFRVYADGIKIYDSGVVTSATPTQTIDVDVTGKYILGLEVTDSGNGTQNDQADWAGARLVTPPRPSFEHVALQGNGLTMSGSRGTPSGLYYLLASTNAAAQLNQWMVIGTNTFDSAGNFALTNLVSTSNSTMFYRLKLP